MPTYAKDVLVDTDWVQQHLGRPVDPDRRGRREPGALRRGPHPRRDRVRLEEGSAGPGQARLPRAREDFGALFGSRGISNDHTIVLYGDRNNWFAAYTYWYLKYYGHDKVKLVNGPREKWIAEGRPTTSDVPAYEPRDVHAPSPATRRSARYRDEVLAALDNGKRLVDVRSPQEFSGELIAMAGYEQEGAQRAGHIPGAEVRAVGAGGDRGRHLQDRRRPARALHGKGVLGATSRSSPTAASASARRTPGSCCTSCSATTTSRTTTARGRSGATS